VAFELRGVVLALFPLAKLARDGNTEPEPSTGGIRFTIGVQVDSAEEVDRTTPSSSQPAEPPAPEHQRSGQVLLRKHGHSRPGMHASRMEPLTSATVGRPALTSPAETPRGSGWLPSLHGARRADKFTDAP